MGLFDFLKNKSQSVKEKTDDKPVRKKSENVQYLNEIQKEVFQYLKPLGFKKKGRTFNRQTESGIWQVINFQSGQFPVGENYIIPGIRESFYGKFTINLGVNVKELYEIQFEGEEKAFYQEYDCQIRTRLSQLTSENADWWNITNESKIISDQIIKGLNDKAISWFDMFESREKICANWGNIKGSSNRAKLDVALIIFQNNKQKGEQLIQEYYNNINSHKGHKEYVKELANGLGLKMTENEAE